MSPHAKRPCVQVWCADVGYWVTHRISARPSFSRRIARRMISLVVSTRSRAVLAVREPVECSYLRGGSTQTQVLSAELNRSAELCWRRTCNQRDDMQEYWAGSGRVGHLFSAAGISLVARTRKLHTVSDHVACLPHGRGRPVQDRLAAHRQSGPGVSRLGDHRISPHRKLRRRLRGVLHRPALWDAVVRVCR